MNYFRAAYDTMSILLGRANLKKITEMKNVLAISQKKNYKSADICSKFNLAESNGSINTSRYIRFAALSLPRKYRSLRKYTKQPAAAFNE